MRQLAVVSFSVLLAACGAQESDAPAATADASAVLEMPTATLEVGEELGGFDGAISGITFWRHPTLAFTSLMLVAHEGGLASYNIEDGEPVDTVDGVKPIGLSLGFTGLGREATGLAATFDTEQSAFRFYRIDNLTRTFALAPSLLIGPKEVSGYCIGRTGAEGGLALHALGDNTIERFELVVSDAGVSASGSVKNAAPSGLVDCVVDDVDGSVFALSDSGDVFRFENGEAAANAAPFARTGATSPIGIGLALFGFVAGGATEECCGHLGVVNGDDGALIVLDRDDGKALGRVSITASFDVEAISSAAAMGLGYGNFGATFRDGVLAIATKDDPSVIRLAPWGGVANALAAPIGEAANPRDLTPQPEESFELDLDVANP